MNLKHYLLGAALSLLAMGHLTGCDDDENGPDTPKAQLITDAELADLGCYMDLHLHLDGSISVANYKRLAAISGIEVTQSDAELQNALQVPDDCKDLNEYLERFDLPLTVLQNSVRASFASETLKATLLQKINERLP